MKASLCLLLLALGVASVAAASEPAWWHGKGDWWGPVRKYQPGGSCPIYAPLVLTEVATVTIIPATSAGVTAGTDGTVWNTISCPSNPAVVIGNCGWTGVYLTDVNAATNPLALGQVNWYGICMIDAPCGSYGVGTISFMGRAGGVEDTTVSDLAIVGGTGAYAALGAKGGTLTYGAPLLGGTPQYTFRFASR